MKDVENLFKRLGTQASYKEYGTAPSQDVQDRWSLLKEVKLLEAAYSLKASLPTAASHSNEPIQNKEQTSSPSKAALFLQDVANACAEPSVSQASNPITRGMTPQFLGAKSKDSTSSYYSGKDKSPLQAPKAAIIPPTLKAQAPGGALLRSLLAKNEAVQVTKMHDSTVVRVRPSLVFKTKKHIKAD